MNFNWKAFEEGKLVYNARTEEDAMAFLEECNKRGLRKRLTMLQYGPAHWKIHGEYTCYGCSTAGVGFCDVEYFRQQGIPFFSEPWKKQESVVEMLRRWNETSSTCDRCHYLMGSAPCHERACGDMYGKIADMVESELETAKQMRCTGYVDNLVHLGRLPEREQGETLEKYLNRTHVVLPRWNTGEIVKEGDPYADTRVEHICVYSDGNWLLNMEDGSQLEGTLNQRAVYVEPDTQERIDWHATCAPDSYCRKFNLDVGDDPDDETATIAMVKHLLERQRKLDAKAGEQ